MLILQRRRSQIMGRPKLQRHGSQIMGRPRLQRRWSQMGRPRLQRRRSQIMGRPRLQRHRLCRSKDRALTAKLIEGLSNKPFAAMRNCPAKIGRYKTSIPKSLVVSLAKREPI
jgi:hypothetical protein